jgi:Glycosyl hydrolases family 16
LAIVAAGAALALCAAQPSSATTPPWTLVLTDNFSGTSLDTTKWYEPYDSPSHYWSPSHAKVANGMLTIDASRQADGHWWSTGINGGRGLKQTYGAYVIRFRMDAGRGISDASMVFPVGDCWPPEIDFAESAGYNSSSRPSHSGFLHYRGAGGCGDDRRLDAGTVSADYTQWHNVGVRWRPGRLIYTLDGTVWSTIASSHVPSTPSELVIQTQSCNPICPDATTPEHVRLQVDWVRMYAYTP